MSETGRAGRAPKIAAVIDIGSTAMRMVVAEILPDGEWRRLDRVTRPIPFGRDVFTHGSISPELMRQSVRIFESFKEVLASWQVEDVKIIATSAIREARNRDTFIDRVFIRTGLRVNILEGVEENFLTFIAVQHRVSPLRAQFARSSTLIIEVGGGSTELMLLQRGKMAAAHSLGMGTVRLAQQVNPAYDSASQIEDYLRENIRVTRWLLDAELSLGRVRYFVAVGGDARLAAKVAGRVKGEGYSVVEKSDFVAFLTGLRSSSVDDCVRELGINYTEAEGLVPALLIYNEFLNATEAEQLIVPDVSVREGVLMSFALGTDKLVQREFHSQVVAGAISLGRKYHFDETHALHVAKHALSLFDQLAAEHGLDEHARLQLEVAAVLHDIGNYIRPSGHHKHGQYIVANSEIFGLSRSDLGIISNIVRYHRKSPPTASHISYVSLRREARIIVLKLSSILRVADALDRSHTQRLADFRLERNDDEVLLHCAHKGDISVERFGLEMKRKMFEDVFGYSINIAH